MTAPDTVSPDGARIDPWQHVRALTPARVALGRTGVSLPTREVLALRSRMPARGTRCIAGWTSDALLAALRRRPGRLEPGAGPRDLSAPPRPRPPLSAPGTWTGCRGDVALVLADGLSPGAVEAAGPGGGAAFAADAGGGGVHRGGRR